MFYKTLKKHVKNAHYILYRVRVSKISNLITEIYYYFYKPYILDTTYLFKALQIQERKKNLSKLRYEHNSFYNCKGAGGGLFHCLVLGAHTYLGPRRPLYSCFLH